MTFATPSSSYDITTRVRSIGRPFAHRRLRRERGRTRNAHAAPPFATHTPPRYVRKAHAVPFATVSRLCTLKATVVAAAAAGSIRSRCGQCAPHKSVARSSRRSGTAASAAVAVIRVRNNNNNNNINNSQKKLPVSWYVSTDNRS